MKRKLEKTILLVLVMLLCACSSGSKQEPISTSGVSAATTQKTDDKQSEEEAKKAREQEEAEKKKAEEEAKKKREAEEMAAYHKEHAGFYPLKSFEAEGQTFTRDHLKMINSDMYLVLEENGEGYIVQDFEGEITLDEFTWDRKELKIKGFASAESYTLTDGVFAFENNAQNMMYEKSEEPAPEKPAAATSSASSTAGGSAGFGIANMSAMNITELYLYPSGEAQSEKAVNSETLAPFKPQVFSHDEVLGKQENAKYDLTVVIDDGKTYVIKEVELGPECSSISFTSAGNEEISVIVMEGVLGGDQTIREIYKGNLK